MSGGTQEGGRWKLQSFRIHPTVFVIEPPEEDEREANTPFGFARAVEPESRPGPAFVEVDHWEGQGL